MNRFLQTMCLAVVVLAPAASAVGDSIELVEKWTVVPTPGSSVYYLNNNLDQGAVLAGQISYGVRQVNSEGTELHSLSIANASKSAVRLGSYYYITGADGQGIGRLDATGAEAWNASSWVDFVNPGPGSESIVTDGTLLFANDDNDRDRIHAYSVSKSDDSFALTEEWSVDLGTTNGRVRGLTYDAGSGFLYMSTGGVGAANTDLYAIDVSTQAFYNIGTHVEGAVTYQALRYGDQLLVVGQSDMLTVYDMLGDTAIDPTPVQQTDLGHGDIYGLAVYGDTLFASGSGARLTGFAIVPEPTSVVLLGLGGLMLFACRRSRCRAARTGKS